LHPRRRRVARRPCRPSVMGSIQSSVEDQTNSRRARRRGPGRRGRG
jgi:hypothetical protein